MARRHPSRTPVTGGLERAPGRGVRLGRHPVEQGEQHGVLGREVEVEGRAGDAGAAGEVVDGDGGQRPLGEQPLGRGEDRQLAVVARGARRPAAAGGAGRSVAGTDTPRGYGARPVLDTTLTRSTECR